MTELQQAIKPFIEKLDAIEAQFNAREIKAVPYGDQRIALLRDGLEKIGDFFNFPASVRYVSTGEFTFNGTRGRRDDSPCEPFGEGLARWLNTIHTRTGQMPSRGVVMAENGWTYINHFDVEKLLRNIVSEG